MNRMTPPPPATEEPGISAATILLLAVACGLIVANNYYAQPLIGPIAEALGLARGAAGLIVTLAQIGYGLELVFIVPLADRFENRRLIVLCVVASALALALASLATSPSALLAAMGAIGLGSVAVQILVPLAAHLAPEAARGRVVGLVSSGLMIGIMAARPASSFVASAFTWRAVFAGSAVLMAALAVLLSRTLPVRRPQARMGYAALIGSMARLAAATPVLRLRAFYQACLFSAFSLFWTTAPLLLAGSHYGLTQKGIALFGLAGVSGAVAAPISGRLADRGLTRPATAAAIVIVAAGFLATIVIPQGSTLALALLVAAAIAIDFGVQANLVLGFRAVFALAPEARPAERSVSGDLLSRRRAGLGGRRLGLRPRRMAACERNRARAAADRALALHLPGGDRPQLTHRRWTAPAPFAIHTGGERRAIRMQREFSLFVGTFTTLLAITNPLEVLPVYLQLLLGKDAATHRAVARKACIYALLLCFFFLVFGTLMLRIFGVPLAMVRVVGGIILMKIGFELFTPQKGAGIAAADPNANIAFVPLAMPLMFGPGAIATIIGMTATIRQSGEELMSFVAIAAAIVLTMFVTYLCLAYADRLSKWLGPMGIDATTRIVGFFVSAIGVGLIFDGVIEALEMHGLTILH